MKQRGRISSAKLAVLPFAGAAPRIQPPADLNATERHLFNDLVATAGHLVPSDFPLIVSYVRATLLASKHRQPGNADQIKVLQAAVKMQTQLATKLRLAPQSRIGPKTTARRHATYTPPSAYELMSTDDD